MEKVLCAAIWFDDGCKHVHQPYNIHTGFVLGGWRHGSILSSAKAALISTPAKFQTQGFLTDKNRFLDRKQALDLVKETGQCTPEFDDELYSEDLY